MIEDTPRRKTVKRYMTKNGVRECTYNARINLKESTIENARMCDKIVNMILKSFKDQGRDIWYGRVAKFQREASKIKSGISRTYIEGLVSIACGVFDMTHKRSDTRLSRLANKDFLPFAEVYTVYDGDLEAPCGIYFDSIGERGLIKSAYSVIKKHIDTDIYKIPVDKREEFLHQMSLYDDIVNKYLDCITNRIICIKDDNFMQIAHDEGRKIVDCIDYNQCNELISRALYVLRGLLPRSATYRREAVCFVRCDHLPIYTGGIIGHEDRIDVDDEYWNRFFLVRDTVFSAI